jgi:predicted HAD superfamily phosphohydrolase YqeG
LESENELTLIVGLEFTGIRAVLGGSMASQTFVTTLLTKWMVRKFGKKLVGKGKGIVLK